MLELKQVVLIVREDRIPLLQAFNKVMHEVMDAGELQRIQEGKPTNQWEDPDVKRYMHHAFMHLVNCKTHEGTHGNPFVLADNTSLEEYKHALVDLSIVAYAEQIAYNQGLVVEVTDD